MEGRKVLSKASLSSGPVTFGTRFQSTVLSRRGGPSPPSRRAESPCKGRVELGALHQGHISERLAHPVSCRNVDASLRVPARRGPPSLRTLGGPGAGVEKVRGRVGPRPAPRAPCLGPSPTPPGPATSLGRVSDLAGPAGRKGCPRHLRTPSRFPLRSGGSLVGPPPWPAPPAPRADSSGRALTHTRSVGPTRARGPAPAAGVARL